MALRRGTRTLLLAGRVRFWRRHYWGHSLVEHFGEEIGGAHPICASRDSSRLAAVGFLLVALLGPVYPFTLTRVERGGLQIMFVVDLSQSMEEPFSEARVSVQASAQAISVAAAGGPRAPARPDARDARQPDGGRQDEARSSSSASAPATRSAWWSSPTTAISCRPPPSTTRA